MVKFVAGSNPISERIKFLISRIIASVAFDITVSNWPVPSLFISKSLVRSSEARIASTILSLKVSEVLAKRSSKPSSSITILGCSCKSTLLSHEPFLRVWVPNLNISDNCDLVVGAISEAKYSDTFFDTSPREETIIFLACAVKAALACSLDVAL